MTVNDIRPSGIATKPPARFDEAVPPLERIAAEHPEEMVRLRELLLTRDRQRSTDGGVSFNSGI